LENEANKNKVKNRFIKFLREKNQFPNEFVDKIDKKIIE